WPGVMSIRLIGGWRTLMPVLSPNLVIIAVSVAPGSRTVTRLRHCRRTPGRHLVRAYPPRLARRPRHRGPILAGRAGRHPDRHGTGQDARPSGPLLDHRVARRRSLHV